jgi:hypothetical protein
MPGLFTLDDATLGKLDESPLGGAGTGFVIGAATSSGLVAGVQGFSGTVVGSVTAAGSVSGSVGFSGEVSGSSTSSGLVAGAAGFTGTVEGSTLTSGTVTGNEGNTGTVTGNAVTVGAATGSPGLSGIVTGSSVSTGVVIGTGPTPPPAPPRMDGGGKWFIPESMRKPMLTGSVRGAASSAGRVVGSISYGGGTRGVTRSRGTVSGVLYLHPTIADIRRISENELLMLDLL